MAPRPPLAPVPPLSTFATLTMFPMLSMLSMLSPLTLTITATERNAVGDLDVSHTPIFRTCGDK
jgi:hypothetical protein